jgi:PhzF family phenazine biosynthesis protein
MEISIYQIDAFASRLFEGNPAAVCPLDKWLPDEIMQAIAAENNLSETAFFTPRGDGFHIRWFTPVSEVDLCGHATLAAAYVLFNILSYKKDRIEFDSRSGILAVAKDNGSLTMDFPSQPPVSCDIPMEIVRAFHASPVECLKSEDLIVVFERETDIESADPDFELLKKLDLRGVVITAESSRYDFVARFFAPKYGIPEDPVTGSAYTQLAPYWASRTGLKKFRVKQMSPRGGELTCEIAGDRVFISGKAIKYLEGKIRIEPDNGVEGELQ